MKFLLSHLHWYSPNLSYKSLLLLFHVVSIYTIRKRDIENAIFRMKKWESVRPRTFSWLFTDIENSRNPWEVNAVNPSWPLNNVLKTIF